MKGDLIHLVLASVTFAAVLWTAASLLPNYRDSLGCDASRLRTEASAILLLALVQIGLGGLVAGLRAGLIYNEWPLMDGHFVPPLDHLFNLAPWIVNFFDNPTLAQFQHRMVAYLLLALTFFHAVHAQTPALGKRAARRALLLFALVFVQAGLGITTLVLAVPLWAALAHQATAMGVLAMAVIHRRKMD